MRPEESKIISTEIKKFFNKKYIKLFNEIKKKDDYSENILDITDITEIYWDIEDEKNNGKKEDFYADLIKNKKIKFIKYYSPKNKKNKKYNIFSASKIVESIHDFICKESKIKNVFKKMKNLEKRKTLDKMILYLFLMNEVLSSYRICTFLKCNIFPVIFSIFFIKDYEYCMFGNEFKASISDYEEFIYYFDKKNDSIMKFISEKKDFGSFFPDKFYDLFFINDIKYNRILKTGELCGICLTEYNDDLISFCEKHFICLECYEEINVEKCINNCETKEFLLYKKVQI